LDIIDRSPPTLARTPAGLQDQSALTHRRLLVAFVCVAIWAELQYWLGAILGADGWSTPDVLIFIAFAIVSPWSVLGACNAGIGFWLLRFCDDPLAEAAPFAAADRKTPLAARTAVLLTLRDEDAARAFARLRAVKKSLDATGEGRLFAFFILSDTSDARIARDEEAHFARWREQDSADAQSLHYRRRSANIGYKAGNIRDFCGTFGDGFEFMIPLDADSLMDGETILRLVRIGEAWPKIGIVQSLVVGAPSPSAFARLFQFGMRAGMRVYTMGAAWWAGDCGPYWGHNALVRIAPFRIHCALPRLSDGSHILSHDQIEAALMRRAGYEVRVLPVETGSYEENPPTLAEFMRRDLRWCRGNMQYVDLLTLPGLLPTSRFQLVWAISMFLGAPAFTAIIALAGYEAHFADASAFPTASALAFYVVFLVLHLAPKLAGYVDAALAPGGLARFGGAWRFAVGTVCEIAASLVVGAVTSFNTTGFLLGLAGGRQSAWSGQARDVHRLSWRDAAKALWPHLVFGQTLFWLAITDAPALLAWSAPLTIGYLVAIPFAVATAHPDLGRLFVRAGLCAAPEELDPPHILQTLAASSTPS